MIFKTSEADCYEGYHYVKELIKDFMSVKGTRKYSLSRLLGKRHHLHSLRIIHKIKCTVL